ncbi:GxxExxY protein [Erythrobacter sp. SDW2]|uniref:GxxExxY protein n=1 Tax=Erythrobacter sp. SDW2 TaxID=2907154 RepID=UPI001F36FAC4|nr:GxxExxY protein [Erythrobacter sp. SDW2]UIP05611.1 GxxExxY protein [Erythrobacter sp. SDW2]
MSRDDQLEHFAREVVDCGFQLHRDIGPRLLESVYEVLLFRLLEGRGLRIARQVPIAISYQGVVIDNAFKADLLVEDRLLIELKSTEKHEPVHAKQVTTYLRLMKLPLGLLINFGMPTFKEGIRRIANDYHSGWTHE